MTDKLSFAIVAEEGREDIAEPVRRIMRRLGHRDLSEEFRSNRKLAENLLAELDVLALAFREDPTYWRGTNAVGAVESFRQTGKPLVIPFIVNDCVVVDRCSNETATKDLMDVAKPIITNVHDPSVFARALVSRIDQSLGKKTSKRQLDRVAKREHAQHPKEWVNLIEWSWDQGERNYLASAADLLDCLLEAALEDFLLNDAKSFESLFGTDRPLGSFSAKIHLCYLLRIISKEERDEFDLIRSIRNRFAHDFRLAAVRDDSVLLDKCDNLKFCGGNNVHESFAKICEESPELARGLEAFARIKMSVDELIKRLQNLTKDSARDA